MDPAAGSEQVAGAQATDTPPLVHLTARQCSRCQETFDLGSSFAAASLSKWWLCQPCWEILISNDPRQIAARGLDAGRVRFTLPYTT